MINESIMDSNLAKNENKFLRKLVLNKYFWLVFCTFFFSYPILRSMNRELPQELPILFTVPEFKFEDENGKIFGSQDLKGRLYIANFFFTSCPTICPKLMEATQKIQKRVKGVGQAIAILSITVDPETDKQKILFDKARELHANPFVWKFLRSDIESTKSLLVDGFKVPVGSKEAMSDNVYDIVHSGKFVLVDGQGNVRGYYSSDKVSIDKLMIDIGLIINRAKLSFKNKES